MESTYTATFNPQEKVARPPLVKPKRGTDITFGQDLLSYETSNTQVLKPLPPIPVQPAVKDDRASLVVGDVESVGLPSEWKTVNNDGTSRPARPNI